jgi:hypothetical protein
MRKIPAAPNAQFNALLVKNKIPQRLVQRQANYAGFSIK